MRTVVGLSLVGVSRKGVYDLLGLQGVVVCWNLIVYVLIDDSYTCLDALNIHSMFFFIFFVPLLY